MAFLLNFGDDKRMKERILDVLLYLFEHYFSDDATEMMRKVEGLGQQLLGAGFTEAEVSRAFDWLNVFEQQQRQSQQSAQPQPPEITQANASLRVFNSAEQTKLHRDSRGFLLFLQTNGVLDASQREMVIDRAMALDQDNVTLDDIKWVVLTALFNQPGSEAAYMWMQIQMSADDPETLH